MTTHSLILSPLEVRAALRWELGLIVRPVKDLGDFGFTDVHFSSFHSIWGPDSWIFEKPLNKEETGCEALSRGLRCPLGVPGDRLVCREPFYIQDAHGQHRTDGLRWGSWSGLPTTISPDGKRIAYYKEGFDRCAPCWRSPATMPAWASRITLEVQGVRCVRVKELTEENATACGFSWTGEPGQYGDGCQSPFSNFEDAWNAKYAKRGLGWDCNPWAWAVNVRRVEG